MMKLKVLLPFGIFKDLDKVESIIVETDKGNFGLLPQRLDCVAAIAPGILSYRQHGEQEMYIAVDEGVVVKAGLEVSISVRHAIAGNNLDQLHNAVKQEFMQDSEQDKKIDAVYQKMESDFIRRLSAFHHDT